MQKSRGATHEMFPSSIPVPKTTALSTWKQDGLTGLPSSHPHHYHDVEIIPECDLCFWLNQQSHQHGGIKCSECQMKTLQPEYLQRNTGLTTMTAKSTFSLSIRNLEVRAPTWGIIGIASLFAFPLAPVIFGIIAGASLSFNLLKGIKHEQSNRRNVRGRESAQ